MDIIIEQLHCLVHQDRLSVLVTILLILVLHLAEEKCILTHDRVMDPQAIPRTLKHAFFIIITVSILIELIATPPSLLLAFNLHKGEPNILVKQEARIISQLVVQVQIHLTYLLLSPLPLLFISDLTSGIVLNDLLTLHEDNIGDFLPGCLIHLHSLLRIFTLCEMVDQPHQEEHHVDGEV